ncbi:MAG TPA: isoprenylcysteine carboxylmethyltransferase family protein [Gemmatimonadaceae bacterium]|nr:isoprenylcysteine carboxylmethyltransferase family protein [Gemmatimonadaceae bacterium]
MSEEATLRVILGAGFLAVLSITLVHRLKSWEAKEQLDRRQEGLFVLAALRMVSLLLWVGLITLVVNPAWMAWSAVSVPAWLRWSGVPVLALGLALLTWALRRLGTNLTDTVVTRDVHTLVINGPYRWVRHPFYDAMGLVVVAFALIAASWFIALTAALFVWLLVIRAPTEEAHLLARFGEEYSSYTRSTGRFLPRLRR